MFPSQSLRQWDLDQSAPNSTRQTATATRREVNPPALPWNTPHLTLLYTLQSRPPSDAYPPPPHIPGTAQAPTPPTLHPFHQASSDGFPPQLTGHPLKEHCSSAPFLGPVPPPLPPRNRSPWTPPRALPPPPPGQLRSVSPPPHRAPFKKRHCSSFYLYAFRKICSVPGGPCLYPLPPRNRSPWTPFSKGPPRTPFQDHSKIHMGFGSESQRHGVIFEAFCWGSIKPVKMCIMRTDRFEN